MTTVLDDDRLDHALLERFDFDREAFLRDQARIADGSLTEADSRFTGRLEPVDDVIDVGWADDETLSDEARAEAEARARQGDEALGSGRVAVVVLNGGMATRFGNVVKGAVEVYDGKSFLALKAEDVRRAAEHYGQPIPLVLMNSFATSEATMADFETHRRHGLDRRQLLDFDQSISVRLNPDGSLFIGADGRPSYHAPGHGDFFRCLRRSGVLATLRARGVTTVLFSNVDNLGATIDPTILGHHLTSGAAMSAEVTAKQRTASGAWDKGGAPCRADGRRQLMEGFRFPPELAPDLLPDFSTNNFVFELAAIDRDIPLVRHVVKKSVDERPVVQLETITCEASGVYEDGAPLLPLCLLRVPREGPRGRFFPVKERVDLEVMRGRLAERLEAGWSRRDGHSLG